LLLVHPHRARNDPGHNAGLTRVPTESDRGRALDPVE